VILKVVDTKLREVPGIFKKAAVDNIFRHNIK
jgi:hypothetical protein